MLERFGVLALAADSGHTDVDEQMRVISGAYQEILKAARELVGDDIAPGALLATGLGVVAFAFWGIGRLMGKRAKD
jgi:hypothetical protein